MNGPQILANFFFHLPHFKFSLIPWQLFCASSEIKLALANAVEVCYIFTNPFLSTT